MNVQDVVKELCKMGLQDIKVGFDSKQDMVYYDLNTGAKSGLILYEDFHVEGRYNYSNKIDIDEYSTVKSVVGSLYWEFKNCLHGRDFFNEQWQEIGVKLGYVEKKVTTHTTVEYI